MPHLKGIRGTVSGLVAVNSSEMLWLIADIHKTVCVVQRRKRFRFTAYNNNQRTESPNIVQRMSSTEEKVTDCVKGSLYHVILWAGDIIKIGPA